LQYIWRKTNKKKKDEKIIISLIIILVIGSLIFFALSLFKYIEKIERLEYIKLGNDKVFSKIESYSLIK